MHKIHHQALPSGANCILSDLNVHHLAKMEFIMWSRRNNLLTTAPVEIVKLVYVKSGVTSQKGKSKANGPHIIRVCSGMPIQILIKWVNWSTEDAFLILTLRMCHHQQQPRRAFDRKCCFHQTEALISTPWQSHLRCFRRISRWL